MRPDGGTPVQPDVRDTVGAVRKRGRRRSCGPRRRRASSSTSRTSCSSRGAGRRSGSRRSESRSGTRSRRKLPLPRPRVRADGDGVLRAARRGRAVVPLLDRRTAGLVPGATACARAGCASASTTPEERSHYSQGTSDIEYLYPIGWSELEGVANRGDYDLTRHTEFSPRSSSTSARTASATCRS